MLVAVDARAAARRTPPLRSRPGVIGRRPACWQSSPECVCIPVRTERLPRRVKVAASTRMQSPACGGAGTRPRARRVGLLPLLKEFRGDDRLACESHLAELEAFNNVNHEPGQIDNSNGIGWRCDHAVRPSMVV